MAGRKSKTKILDEALQHKEFERMRIIEILKSLGKFTPALNPLIEMYLDACEVYHIKYLEWKDSGFKSTKVHTNKMGQETKLSILWPNKLKFGVRKTKLLNQLGLDMKSGGLDYVDPLASENAKKKKKLKR